MAVTTIWIADECTGCRECEQIAPDVFQVDDEEGTCLVLGKARQDGISSTMGVPLP